MWVNITSNEKDSEQEEQFKITSTLLTTNTKDFIFDKQQHTERTTETYTEWIEYCWCNTGQ
jgi:hypothetical protein